MVGAAGFELATPCSQSIRSLNALNLTNGWKSMSWRAIDYNRETQL